MIQGTNESPEVFFQRLIDLLPTRIFWKDQNLVYLGCNLAFAKDAGKESPNELLGKDDYVMGWKDQAELYRADDQQVLDTGKKKIHFEEPQTTPSGETIWLRTSKVPLTDTAGNIVGVLGIYDDITDVKKAQIELEKKTEELEKINKLSIDRELKMIALKERNVELEETLKNI